MGTRSLSTLTVYVWERDYIRRHRLEPGSDAKLSPFSGPFFRSGPCYSCPARSICKCREAARGSVQYPYVNRKQRCAKVQTISGTAMAVCSLPLLAL